MKRYQAMRKKVKLLKCLESKLRVIVCDLALLFCLSGKSHEFNYNYNPLPFIIFHAAQRAVPCGKQVIFQASSAAIRRNEISFCSNFRSTLSLQHNFHVSVVFNNLIKEPKRLQLILRSSIKTQERDEFHSIPCSFFIINELRAEEIVS